MPTNRKCRPSFMAIVYRAMMMYGRFTAAGEVFNDGEQNYRRILTALVRNQTPMVRMGGHWCDSHPER